MMLYDILWCYMMLYDVIAVDFIAKLCVFQLNVKLKPSYIPHCGIFLLHFNILNQFPRRGNWLKIETHREFNVSIMILSVILQ